MLSNAFSTVVRAILQAEIFRSETHIIERMQSGRFYLIHREFHRIFLDGYISAPKTFKLSDFDIIESWLPEMPTTANIETFWFCIVAI